MERNGTINEVTSDAVRAFIKSNALELRKVNVLGGPIHESVAFNAEVFVNGDLIGRAADDGNGGGVYLDALVVEAGDADRLNETANALDAAKITWFISEYGDKKPCHWELSELIGAMVEEIIKEREWKTRTRGTVWIQTKDCKRDEWYQWKRGCKVSEKRINANRETSILITAVRRYGLANIVAIRGFRTIDDWRALGKRYNQTTTTV